MRSAHFERAKESESETASEMRVGCSPAGEGKKMDAGLGEEGAWDDYKRREQVCLITLLRPLVPATSDAAFSPSSLSYR